VLKTVRGEKQGKSEELRGRRTSHRLICKYGKKRMEVRGGKETTDDDAGLGESKR